MVQRGWEVGRRPHPLRLTRGSEGCEVGKELQAGRRDNTDWRCCIGGSEKKSGAGSSDLHHFGGEKRVHKILDFFSQIFVFIASLKSSHVLQPIPSQGGTASQGPAALWHLEAKGGVDRALYTLTSEGHSVLGSMCYEQEASLGFTVTNASHLVTLLLAWVSLNTTGWPTLTGLGLRKILVSFTVGGCGRTGKGYRG